MILIILLFGMVVCLDPVDIDLLQPLNIPGIRTQQVTFYGVEYLIIDPDPEHFINTVRYGNNLMFQKNENNSCLKIVRVNNGVHSFLYLRVITPANQDIQLRFFLQDGPPVLGRMSPTVTTVNTVMRYAANLHPSLNPRGFNIFDNPLPLDEDEGDSDDDDSDGDEGDEGDEGPEGGEGDDGDEGPEGGDGAVDEGIDHDFDQDIDDAVSGILGVGDLPNVQAALGVDQEGIQGMIGGLNQFIPNLPEIPEQDEPGCTTRYTTRYTPRGS
eukprot:XP_765430.1 hypothetical protein [Theileria parva strain Muguga]